jgi:hypothetical protein
MHSARKSWLEPTRLREIFDKLWVLGALLQDDGSSSIVDDASMKQH